MPYKNAVFSRQSHFRTAVTKMTGNTFFKLSTFLSLAVVIQISGWNKPIHALDFSNLAQQTSNIQQGWNSLKSPENSAFLPQIFRLLAFSTKSQAVASDATPAQVQEPEASTKSKSLTPVAKPLSQIHRVKRGDTIHKIASQYQVSVNELVELNQIQNANLISVDRQLKIPNSQPSAIANNSTKSLQPSEQDPYITQLKAEIDQLRAQYKQEKFENSTTSSLISAGELETQLEESTQTSSIKELNTPPKSILKSNSSEVDTIALTLPPLADDEYLPSAFDGYTWPAQGVLTSGYGRRWGRLHRGIDIAAPVGTPIVAAAAGKVVGAGWHGGYGNLVKLEHPDGSITYYAHLNRILVSHDQQVRQGELIAEMGSTGNSTGSHLHFEIHLRDRTIVNPLALLGSR